MFKHQETRWAGVSSIFDAFRETFRLEFNFATFRSCTIYIARKKYDRARLEEERSSSISWSLFWILEILGSLSSFLAQSELYCSRSEPSPSCGYSTKAEVVSILVLANTYQSRWVYAISSEFKNTALDECLKRGKNLSVHFSKSESDIPIIPLPKPWPCPVSRRLITSQKPTRDRLIRFYPSRKLSKYILFFLLRTAIKFSLHSSVHSRFKSVKNS